MENDIPELDIDVRDILMPEDLVQKWQNIVNIMANIINVPAALIMKVELPFIEVFRSSESNNNPYKVGDREHLTGLYCETVINSKKKLLIPNALKDKNWDKNPDIKLGMISYLGFPLLFPNDDIFGTICVLDYKENDYSENYEHLILEFKVLIETHLTLLYEKSKIKELLAFQKKMSEKLKKSEENLKKLNIELDQRIEDRTKELKRSEEKYRIAYNHAEFYKDLFTHDIKNILQSILSGIQLNELYLNNPENLETLKENMVIIKDQVIKGSELVLNIHKLSHLEEAKLSLKSIEILNFLECIIEFIKNTYKERDVSIQINSTNKKLFVQADELLEDIFKNILINAIRHNKNPNVEIIIKISKEQQGNINFIKLEFLDNAKGIENNRKKEIFQRANSQKRIVHGMGLGLSLVKKIIDSYNGQIWVEDRIKGDSSKGSNFIVLIPEVV